MAARVARAAHRRLVAEGQAGCRPLVVEGQAGCRPLAEAWPVAVAVGYTEAEVASVLGKDLDVFVGKFGLRVREAFRRLCHSKRHCIRT